MTQLYSGLLAVAQFAVTGYSAQNTPSGPMARSK